MFEFLAYVFVELFWDLLILNSFEIAAWIIDSLVNFFRGTTDRTRDS